MSSNIINDKKALEAIKAVSFFKMFSDNDEMVRRIAGMCTKKIIKKGKVLIEEGNSGDELYILINGEIEIVKKTLQDEKYTVVTLDSKVGGIYVGEFALIDKDKRSATVTAKTDCEYLVIKRANFLKFGDEYPQVGLHITREIARSLSTRLRKSNTDVITLFSALVEEIATGE